MRMRRSGVWLAVLWAGALVVACRSPRRNGGDGQEPAASENGAAATDVSQQPGTAPSTEGMNANAPAPRPSYPPRPSAALSLAPPTPAMPAMPVMPGAGPGAGAGSGAGPAGGDLVRTAPLSFSPIVRAADPGVVTINTSTETPEALLGSRKVPKSSESGGLGTGFLVDNEGTVLTNNHVIDGADSISVKLADEREFPAGVLGRDPSTDIAVLKIDAPNIAPLPLGDSDVAEVGDWVVAIGNPFGLSHTVSVGIVSAKGRTKTDVPLDPSGYYDFLQTDASINPGNSGGPLLNLRGEVIGINSAIRGGGAQGIGFAIPINMVKQLLPMLKRDGHVTRSALGIRIQDVRALSAEDRQALKLTEEKDGALIVSITPKGAAEKAGLRTGDVILAFEGIPIDKGTHLQWLASTAGVGRTTKLKVFRAGEVFEVKVVLGQLSEGAARKLVDPTSKRRVAPVP